MPNLDPASDIVERTREIVAGHAGRLGPLLPILHDVQHAFGHLPEESLRTIADRLNLSRATRRPRVAPSARRARRHPAP